MSTQGDNVGAATSIEEDRPQAAALTADASQSAPPRAAPPRAAPPRAAYVHVPFCRHKCGYCDFAVVAGRDDLVEPYLAAVARELSWIGEPREVDTLYFGGGTPSYLSPEQFAQLADAATRWHPLAAACEWTVEANPEHVSAELVASWARLGVTRISLGVQTFDEQKLRALDREHTGEEARRAVEVVRQAGLVACVDLMFAAPGETLADWRSDLEAVVALPCEHVSTYGLTFEHGTPFTQARDRGRLAAADEELERAMYCEAIERLAAAGYEHYEVSNFARPGRRSRHNEVYWSAREYFAAGPGAARYVAGVRETNHRSTVGYLRRVLAGESPVADREELTPEQKARERLVLGLRRLEGVERTAFHDASGYDLDELAGPTINRLAVLGLLAVDGQGVRLTREGLLVSDSLWPELL